MKKSTFRAVYNEVKLVEANDKIKIIKKEAKKDKSKNKKGGK